MQARQIDNHALVGPIANLLDLVASGHVEFNAPTVNLGHLGFSCHAMADRRRRKMARVDGRADRALTGLRRHRFRQVAHRSRFADCTREIADV